MSPNKAQSNKMPCVDSGSNPADELDSKRGLKRARIEEETLMEIQLYEMEKKKLSFANMLEFLAKKYFHLKDYKNSLSNILKSLEIKEILSKRKDNHELADLHHTVGTNYYCLSDYKNALLYFFKSVEMRMRLYANRDHSEIANSFQTIGSSYYNLKLDEKALEYHAKALEMKQRIYEGQDSFTIAYSLSKVGNCYYALKNYDEALKHHFKALDMRRKLFDHKDDLDIANSLQNVGTTYSSMSDYKNALNYQLKALSMRQRLCPADSDIIGVSHSKIGTLYALLKEPEKELENHTIALEIKLKKHKEMDHADLATCLDNVGDAYSSLDFFKLSSEYKLKALEMRERLAKYEANEKLAEN